MSKISLPVSPQANDGEKRILSGRVKLDQLGLINESSARSTQRTLQSGNKHIMLRN